MVLVTHDIEEALVLSDRIAVMQPGAGHIQEIVQPPLARPRDRTGPEFAEWKQRLLAELHRSFHGPRGDESFFAAAI